MDGRDFKIPVLYDFYGEFLTEKQKDAIVFWAWKTYKKRKEQYSKMVEENPYKIKEFIILKRPKEAVALLKRIPEF